MSHELPTSVVTGLVETPGGSLNINNYYYTWRNYGDSGVLSVYSGGLLLNRYKYTLSSMSDCTTVTLFKNVLNPGPDIIQPLSYNICTQNKLLLDIY